VFELKNKKRPAICLKCRETRESEREKEEKMNEKLKKTIFCFILCFADY